MSHQRAEKAGSFLRKVSAGASLESLEKGIGAWQKFTLTIDISSRS